MIPAAMITEWSQQCPWISSAQVEQDLILSRALVEIYRVPALRESLVFRGGTALHKLVLQPAARYSEDLDFVQIREEPIGPTFDLLRDALEPWLGEPKTDISPRGATQIYRFESETPPIIRLRLKIEINTREHFHIHPLEERKFEVDSRWFNGSAQVPVYALSELLAPSSVRSISGEKVGTCSISGTRTDWEHSTLRRWLLFFATTWMRNNISSPKPSSDQTWKQR